MTLNIATIEREWEHRYLGRLKKKPRRGGGGVFL